MALKVVHGINMNLIGVFVTKLWPVQALACGDDGGGATKIENQ